jgi:hypothetical protein
MVFYFECCEPIFTVFMGRDKYENEELLKFAFPEDVWFHVDELSSAHVYLRRPLGMKLDEVPPHVIDEMCQLVKQNSIGGSKAAKVDIIYCEFENLVKTRKMEAGQVSYKSEKCNRYRRGVEKDREILRRIERTRIEKNPDLQKLREDRDREMKGIQKKRFNEREKERIAEKQKAAEADDLLNYVSFQNRNDLKTHTTDESWRGDGSIEHCKKIEDDFM